MSKDRTVLVTGSAGFIGFHLSTALLRDGWSVIGLDCLTDHTDVTLKTDREAQLTAQPGFHPVRMRLEEPGGLLELMARHKPELVVHLAGQAGVRHSIDFPRDFLDSNLTGTFELLEAARAHPPRHMLMASSSSAYGSERQMPFRETMKSDHQMSFYAATKKATENMAHSYAHLFGLPITMFRFFTVYGPWGRPDMAMFKFTKAILNGDPIDVYNFGDMRRDFTYIDDLIRAITLLTGVVPPMPGSGTAVEQDSLSPVAPFRMVNIGNSAPVPLLEFIEAIETATGKIAKKNMMRMQPGDVPATWADAQLLRALTGYEPQTGVRAGVQSFVDWYRGYYRV